MKPFFEICWYNFYESDCRDTWSALFLCKTGPFFFVFFDFPEERERISETLARKFEKFHQSQRAGLLKLAMRALKRVGLGPCRQVYFGKRGLKMKEKPQTLVRLG